MGSIIIARDFLGYSVKSEGGESYEIEEIGKHNSAASCWILSENKVYDITLFLQLYPENIEDMCGGEVAESELTPLVWKVLENYKIGNLKSRKPF
ncbi:MAG: cytochrome b5 domain-containing protein [Nanoarchaeota archaeon]